MSFTSQAAELFQEQTGGEKRRLLRVVLGKATWQTGELRMSFREPFEQLRLSNSVSETNDGSFGGGGPVSGIWRRERDSNICPVLRWRNLLILRSARHARNARNATPGYTPGTRVRRRSYFSHARIIRKGSFSAPFPAHTSRPRNPFHPIPPRAIIATIMPSDGLAHPLRFAVSLAATLLVVWLCVHTVRSTRAE
jgi:hypothetical protein